MASGFVSFVALGPGDEALRTERAARRLAEADAVITREVAATELVRLAREGKRVVYATAGEGLESTAAAALARAVASAGISIEVIPGVGARAAAAAFAGVLGEAHRVSPAEVAAVLGEKDGRTPVTLITHAGTARQRVLVTTAGQAPARARAFDAEEVIVAIGAPDEALRWFERRPLFGKRILVTRAREQAGSLAALLREEGATPLVVPTIEIRPPTEPAHMARALENLKAGHYQWVVFTSANGVDWTWAALTAAGGDARAFGASRLAVIGPATARALESRGLRADIVPKEFRGEGLVTEMLASQIGAKHERVLLARAARARDLLPDSLRVAGCVVDVVAAYETHPPPRASIDALAHDIEAGRVDAVTFTSSSTVEHLCDLLGEPAIALLTSVHRVACIGPVTAETARARGLRVDVVADEYTVPGLVRALAGALRTP
jgi:uroporphyrinogen III methyltransferase / synthase